MSKRPDWPSWVIMGVIALGCVAIFVYVAWLS